ncbi:MAG: TetR/AcrR family transcriptional regulator [Eggerthellaceae bacterium]|nr:TetR/AcrR family transcriptional regulator [Eggerthellaceae bacterium]
MDLRVKKTKRAIREALLALLAEKPLADVTIKELCEAAEVSKPAFYYHYGNTHDVLSEIEDELASDISRKISLASEIDLCSPSFLRTFRRNVYESPLRPVLADSSLHAEFIHKLSTELGNRPGGNRSDKAFGAEALAMMFAFAGLLGIMERLSPSDYEKAVPDLSELMRSLLG